MRTCMRVARHKTATLPCVQPHAHGCTSSSTLVLHGKAVRAPRARGRDVKYLLHPCVDRIADGKEPKAALALDERALDGRCCCGCCRAHSSPVSPQPPHARSSRLPSTTQPVRQQSRMLRADAAAAVLHGAQPLSRSIVHPSCCPRRSFFPALWRPSSM